MSDERESRIDTCVECCVRDRDFSKKKVYRCELCDRWFCERHFEPRLAFIRNYQAIVDSPEIRALYYTEMQRQDGHPDFEYSEIKFSELAIEEQSRSQLIREAFDRMNAHYRGKSKAKSIPEVMEDDYQQSERDFHLYEKPRTRKPFTVKVPRQLGYIFCIVCGIVLSIFEFPFTVKYQSFDTPFLGNYQIHSIVFLGSPIYTWDSWNGVVGPIDFFLAFILNTIVCLVIFLMLQKLID